MVQASKWGSWAYDMKERERKGKVKVHEFQEWRRQVMEDIYKNKKNEN